MSSTRFNHHNRTIKKVRNPRKTSRFPVAAKSSNLLKNSEIERVIYDEAKAKREMFEKNMMKYIDNHPEEFAEDDEEEKEEEEEQE